MDFLYGSLSNDIKALDVFSVNYDGTYCGIAKKYFSKWEGWKMLENGESQLVVQQAAINFYMVFFFFHLKLDLLDNPTIRWALLNFATKHGKKKAISKIEQVIGIPQTGRPSAKLMGAINRLPKSTEYKLLLEMIEFYAFTGNYEESRWVIDLFRVSTKS